jgi:hypothetical protein
VAAKRVTLRASCVSPTTYITKQPPLAIVLISMSHVKGRAKQMYFSHGLSEPFWGVYLADVWPWTRCSPRAARPHVSDQGLYPSGETKETGQGNHVSPVVDDYVIPD